eukprot:7804882-Pyramimonas_sp.AAC.1
MNRAVQVAVQRAAPPRQRGFVRGRSCGINILELDSHAHELSLLHPQSLDIPALCSLDFGQAIPSLNQQLLECILQSLVLP